MTYEAFIEDVCARTGGDGVRDLAERAVRATLEAVGERLSDNDARQLADLLPAPLSRFLGHPGHHAAFSPSALYQHVEEEVPERLGIAVEHARVVCEVLGEALGPD